MVEDQRNSRVCGTNQHQNLHVIFENFQKFVKKPPRIRVIIIVGSLPARIEGARVEAHSILVGSLTPDDYVIYTANTYDIWNYRTHSDPRKSGKLAYVLVAITAMRGADISNQSLCFRIPSEHEIVSTRGPRERVKIVVYNRAAFV